MRGDDTLKLMVGLALGVGVDILGCLLGCAISLLSRVLWMMT